MFLKCLIGFIQVERSGKFSLSWRAEHDATVKLPEKDNDNEFECKLSSN